ncbi:hypothetical protein M501DRAFT_1034404 [Patellaria atrata CBS 101060]|uniref:NB-ARC domain-containing protein n=1 Tax=Patellaria atrata CBS 101060 TaxID=1346257 RepID=A0A9P4VJN9_9PEZI|nr:hypothetical protein M501DRAFT_1034404 [Patellaria atrata CBS 101060]
MFFRTQIHERIQEVAHLAFRRAHTTDLEAFQRALSLKDINEEDAIRPCLMLPSPRNCHFFGRQDLINRIDSELTYSKEDGGIRSVALHGLRGVGKTQVALAFAYSKMKYFDPIFWVAAEMDVVLKQSFSRIAVNLKLLNAHPQNHEENTLLVLSWLNQTILVTARQPTIATQPIDVGIEIHTFSAEDEAGFLKRLLPNHSDSEAEERARMDLFMHFSGHALALARWRLSSTRSKF